MVTEAGKELLRNTINTAKFHNRILEENEMWKQWELECGLTMMVSDDDIIKRIKKNHQCSKHHKRDKSRSRDGSRSKYEVAKIRQGAGSSNDRWDHSGFAELYPDADVPDKYPSTSLSSADRHKKKKKKSRHRSDSSDEEIWEEFKRPAQIWNRETILRLIELLREAPALWNINYPGYRDQRVKLKEIKRIAKVFDVFEKEIMDQITFLMDEFHEEHKKLTLKKLNGAYANFSENQWFAYERLTFLINNKTERICKTFKNYLRKGENPQWIDSSDSYSESEDETSRPSAKQSSRCIKSKVQDKKMDVNEKKGKCTQNMSSYSEDETSRPSVNKSSRCIKSKALDEKMDVNGKQAKYTSQNMTSYSEDETSRPSVNQSSRCIKSKVQDEEMNVNGKKSNYTCIDLTSCSDNENETSRPSANQSNCCVQSKVKDDIKDWHGKNADHAYINLPYVQAYMAQKDSFSVYGEIVAHRMRQAKKSGEAAARAECEINIILRKFEAGFFDSPEDAFK